MPDDLKQSLKKAGFVEGTLTVDQARQKLKSLPPEVSSIIKELCATLKAANDTYWAGKKTGGLSLYRCVAYCVYGQRGLHIQTKYGFPDSKLR